MVVANDRLCVSRRPTDTYLPPPHSGYMNRRKFLTGAGGIVAAGLAGCLGVVGLDEHEATPAGVEESVSEETGYERTGVEEIVVTEQVDAPGISDEVTVRNYLTEYEKAIDLGPLGSVRAAAFMVLTSPQISIVGRDFNPISDMSSDELIEMIQADFDGINDVERVSEGEMTILGQTTVESVFDAEADVEGTTVDVRIHLTESVETSQDHLVTVGVYPTRARSVEADNIAALMGAIVEDAA